LPVKELLMSRGYVTLYPPQEEAIKQGVLEGENVVLAIPTASGKTLVAELCMIKHVLEKGGKALYMVPLRALASEKYEEFKKYEELGIKVAISTGDYDSSDPWLESYDIIVCTNEKADSLLRHNAPWLRKVSIVIADEVHLINEPSRGPTLEAVLARLLQNNPNLQILALSATIRNADEIAKWLKAKLVVSEWRPVTLREGVYAQGEIVFKDGSIVKVDERFGDPAVTLAVDVVKSGGQALIFASSRQSAVSLAKKLQDHIAPLLKQKEKNALREVAEQVLSVGEKTKLSEKLSELIQCGVAFHHAGLHGAHRKIIEDAFRALILKVVCATPTLAAGVNLPARRVILRDYRRYEPGLGYQAISILEEKQMAGRAGRPRYDKYGEAILVAKNRDEQEFLLEQYVLAEPERIWSKLGTEPALRSHILSTIASGFANTEAGILDFLNYTFYAHQYGSKNLESLALKVIEFLEREDMVERSGQRLYATKLGKRVSELYIDPLSAVIMRDGLSKRPSAIAPIGLLHLICHTPDMPKLYLKRRDLEPLSLFASSNSQVFLVEMPDEFEDPEGYELFLAELKTAMLLNDWIEEVPEDSIIDRYDVGSGDIHAYVETARWLLYSMYELAKVLEIKEVLADIHKLLLRVESGVKEELLPLVQLRGIGRARARALYNAGYRHLEDLRKATVTDLLKVPLIGPETAKSIKEQLGSELTKEELEKVKKASKQLSLFDYTT